MKRWLMIIGITLAALILIGFLYDQGFMDFKWQGLTMIIAALAGPYQFIKNHILQSSKSTQELIQRQEDIRVQELEHRTDFDIKVKASEDKIKELNKELEMINTRYEILEAKKRNIQSDINKLSIEEKQREAQDLLGK
jgi:hypothetical protein